MFFYVHSPECYLGTLVFRVSVRSTIYSAALSSPRGRSITHSVALHFLPPCLVLADFPASKSPPLNKKLHGTCAYAIFFVPLHSNPTLEGNMSCEKRFAKGLSKGRFLTYWIAFIALCVWWVENFATFLNLSQIKVTVNAYGYDHIHAMLVSGIVCCHISVGFLLFI